EVVFVENHAPAAVLIRRNLASLGIRKGATVLAMDALRSLEKLGSTSKGKASAYDYVFLDPPYAAANDYVRVLESLGWGNLLAPGGVVIAEHRPNFALPDATGAARAPVHLPEGRRPQLDIAWGSFHQGISSSLGVLLRKSPVPETFTIEGFFKYCWIEGQLPRRAILAAALWHVVFFVLPYPQLPSRAHPNPAFDNVELSWSGPVNDLPLLELKAAKPQPEPKPTPQSEPEKPPPREGADAFHPRQHIFSDPVRPNHPRQTLINSAAPPEPPKILPNLPNMVQIQDLAGPARPRLVISKEELAKLHPKQRRLATVTDAPPPDVPMLEQKPGELALMASPNAPARPSLELNAGASPRIAPKAQPGDSGPAPEVGAAELAGANGNPATLIALAATPAPPSPVVPPQGNLAARVSISPEGKKPGVPGGSPKGTPGATGGTG